MLIVKMQAWNRENTQYTAALQIDAIAIGKGPIRRNIRTLPHWNYARIESTGKSIQIVLSICCHSPTQPNSSLEWSTIMCSTFPANLRSWFLVCKHAMHSKAWMLLFQLKEILRRVGGVLDQMKISLTQPQEELELGLRLAKFCGQLWSHCLMFKLCVHYGFWLSSLVNAPGWHKYGILPC